MNPSLSLWVFTHIILGLSIENPCFRVITMQAQCIHQLWILLKHVTLFESLHEDISSLADVLLILSLISSNSSMATAINYE